MAKRIAVIGAGPGGYVAAIRAAQLGAKVTVIEQENIGGTCLNWGCIPSKVMRTMAETVERFHRAHEFGIKLHGDIGLDLNDLMKRKETVIQNQARGVARLLDQFKILYLAGNGTIKGTNLVGVRLCDGRTIEVPWDSLILALGSEPLNIPSFPFDGKSILSSRDALNLHEIPESILILGGGVIGCEFAFIFALLGSKVTVVEAMPRILPLPSVDEDCSRVLQREMKKRRIRFLVNRTVDEVQDEGEGLRITIGPSPFGKEGGGRDMKPLTLQAQKMLVCIGRRPNSANVGLEELGIEMDNRGWIIANERMQTNVSEVYAIGDVLGPSRVMLAHVAATEGLCAAENAMGQSRTMNYDVVPLAIFTVPEVASVGLSEVQAREQGYNVRSESVLFRNLGKPHVIGEIAGHAKIVSDAEDGRILGVHIVGPNATDLIAEGALATQLGCTVKKLAETMHAHPTLAEVMLEACFKASDRPLHG